MATKRGFTGTIWPSDPSRPGTPRGEGHAGGIPNGKGGYDDGDHYDQLRTLGHDDSPHETLWSRQPPTAKGSPGVQRSPFGKLRDSKKE